MKTYILVNAGLTLGTFSGAPFERRNARILHVVLRGDRIGSDIDHIAPCYSKALCVNSFLTYSSNPFSNF